MALLSVFVFVKLTLTFVRQHGAELMPLEVTAGWRFTVPENAADISKTTISIATRHLKRERMAGSSSPCSG